MPGGAGIQGLHGPNGSVHRMLGKRGLPRARVAWAPFEGLLDPCDGPGKGVRGQLDCTIKAVQYIIPLNLATIKQESSDPPKIPA